jgi:hypothetical protein
MWKKVLSIPLWTINIDSSLSSCRFNRFSPNRQPSLGQRTDTLRARYAFDGFLPAVRAVALPSLATWKAVLLEGAYSFGDNACFRSTTAQPQGGFSSSKHFRGPF